MDKSFNNSDGATADTLPGVRYLMHLPETESTQYIAKALANAGCAGKTAVIADRQTGGYGRLDHKWVSAPGGLYLSLLLRPETSPEFLSDLSGLVAGVLAGVFRERYGLSAKVKQPNDVYVFHAEKKTWLKISGVLSESSSSSAGKKSEWLVIGIGVNISNTELPETAVCLNEITGGNTGVMEFARQFLREFWPEYFRWELAGRLRS
jgi:biotin-[acetyl-CoA-carboxylase] ligase BirA-like protein